MFLIPFVIILNEEYKQCNFGDVLGWEYNLIFYREKLQYLGLWRNAGFDYLFDLTQGLTVRTLVRTSTQIRIQVFTGVQ